MPDASHALPIGTRLAEFEIVGVVGEGGFGIVYLAQDHLLERQVALKEFMPSSLARRGEGVGVEVRTPRVRDTFDAALRSFVNEARLLARFDHPALVKVFRFWEANGTAYMVMPYYRGPTLREALQRPGGTASEPWLRELLAPLLDALERLHAENCFHRDIAPDNILILDDGRPLLLDFGAARRVIGDVTQDLTVILKPGFAPIEQYVNGPEMRQGPWTDVYALASVVHYCVTGKTPPPSVSRMMNDTMEQLAPGGPSGLSPAFCAAVTRALAVRVEDRTPSMAVFRRELGITEVMPTRLGPVSRESAGIPGGSGGTIPDDWDRTVVAPPGRVPPLAVPPSPAMSPPPSPAGTRSGAPPPGGALFDGLDEAASRAGGSRDPSEAGAVPRSAPADDSRPPAIATRVDRDGGSAGRWGVAVGGAMAVVAIVVASAWWFGGGATSGRRTDEPPTRPPATDLARDTPPTREPAPLPATPRVDPVDIRPGSPGIGPTEAGRGPVVDEPRPAAAPSPLPAEPPPLAPAWSPDAVIDALASAGDPQWQVEVKLDRDTVRIGKDRLRFSITSSRAGYVYLLMAGTDKSHFYLLFPNAIDRNNRIGVDKPVALPRQNWEMVADGPEGTDRLLAIVSPVPRDFSGAGLRAIAPFAEFERSVAEGVFAAQGPMPFAGTATGCSPGDAGCARFGARVFEIREVR